MALVKKHRILLIEDDSIQSNVYQSALSRFDAEITVTDTVTEAIRMFLRSPPSLCIVDLGIYLTKGEFDREGGLKFLEQASGAHPSVPLIVLTAIRDPEILLRCFVAGCHDYIIKGDGFDDAVARLKYWIDALPVSKTELERHKSEAVAALKLDVV